MNDRLAAANDAREGPVARRGKTLLIGMLSRIEDAFGHLWAAAKPAAECSDDELDWRAAWVRLRKDLLDYGHGHLRALERELG